MTSSNYRFQCRVEEGHGQTIYDLRFCNFGPPYNQYFATVGGNTVGGAGDVVGGFECWARGFR